MTYEPLDDVVVPFPFGCGFAMMRGVAHTNQQLS